MSTAGTTKKSKKFFERFPHVYVILFGLIILAAILFAQLIVMKRT
mgnify:CR=1 FL=1